MMSIDRIALPPSHMQCALVCHTHRYILVQMYIHPPRRFVCRGKESNATEEVAAGAGLVLLAKDWCVCTEYSIVCPLPFLLVGICMCVCNQSVCTIHHHCMCMSAYIIHRWRTVASCTSHTSGERRARLALAWSVICSRHYRTPAWATGWSKAVNGSSITADRRQVWIAHMCVALHHMAMCTHYTSHCIYS